eukprot:169888_1
MPTHAHILSFYMKINCFHSCLSVLVVETIVRLAILHNNCHEKELQLQVYVCVADLDQNTRMFHFGLSTNGMWFAECFVVICSSSFDSISSCFWLHHADARTYVSHYFDQRWCVTQYIQSIDSEVTIHAEVIKEVIKAIYLCV